MSASTTAGRKPAAPAAAGRKTPTTNSTSSTSTPNISRSPSRMAASQSTSSASPAANGLNRARSVRTGAPVSARAAAASRKQTPDAAEEDAKAELNAKVEELQQKLMERDAAYEELEKQNKVLSIKLDEARKEQEMLEETMHENTERINDLENERKENNRKRREEEQIYESERVAFNKHKEEADAREAELVQTLERMKSTLANRELRAGLDDDRRPMISRQSSNGRSSDPSPNPDSSDRQFAPSSIHRSDSASRNTSALVMQKDKLIESLRLELADAHIKLVEIENMGGGRMQELQKQVYEIKIQNARLMEENESFQLLLSEKTLNGDFLRPPSNLGSRPPSRNPTESEPTVGASLADELDSHVEEEGDEEHRRLQAEVHGLKDQNKALTLYINNIISRLLQHDGLEQILDKTPDLMSGPNAASRKHQDANTEKELPPPPPEKDEQPAGLLQRARSVLGGKPRPRPLSQLMSGDESPQKPLPVPAEPSKHENPSTAPSVPIGRSNSTRAPSGHRRANSDWSAANVVTNMYKGPQNSISGPLSPGLTSPTGRNSFFGGPAMRAPSSGSNVPTISETADGEKENAIPQRDSKMSANSNRNSMISNAGTRFDGIDQDRPMSTERSNPSSPPRSTDSSEISKETKPSGAIMMGSKPRPLRLVQEAADDEAAKKQANRSSWFGWMNKGGAPPGSSGSVFGGQSPAQ